MHRVMRDSPYQAAALLPDTESLPPGGIGGRLSKGHIDYDPCEQSRKLRISVTRIENGPAPFSNMAWFLL